jgi:anti-anti-sigma factor
MDTFGGPVQPPGLCFHRTVRADGGIWLAVDGEIDMTTGDQFRHTLALLVNESGVSRLLLDLTQLRFMDSNGVSMLLTAQRTAEERGIPLRIVNAQAGVRHVLETLGVYETLTAEGQRR